MKSNLMLFVLLIFLSKSQWAIAIQAGTELHLVFVMPSDHCQLEDEIFDVENSLRTAVDHSVQQTHGLIQRKEVCILVHVIPGCSLMEGNRMEEIVSFLRQLEPEIETLKGYTVYIGPPAGSTCAFINDWIAQSKLVQAAYGSLRQIDYACIADSLVRYYAKMAPKRDAPDVCHSLASVTIGLPNEELYRPLGIFLRQRGWKNIAILYEWSQMALQNVGVCETIDFLLSNANGVKMNVFHTGSLQWDSDPVRIVSGFAVKCQAIVLIARPDIASFFLYKVRDMPIVRNGEIAIVVFDAGNVLSYDVMRLWKLMLEKGPELGAAAQCLFLMTGLPSSSAFDMRSELLDSNISVPIAISAGMAVGLTYLNMKANNNTIPSDRDFFGPIMNGVVEFPVLPNMTFFFGRKRGEFIMPYDYYFFGVSEKTSRSDFNAGTATFEDIFVLHSVLLWPRRHLVELAIKAWPGGGSGPESDHCIQSPCHSLTTISTSRNVNVVDHIMNIMEKYSAELEAQVEDRTRDLKEEKQRTEMLIASMLPSRVAQKLIAGNPVPPETFDEATIYFSDVVGFPLISAKSTGVQIAEFLNDLYSTFDIAIRNFDVYKVETIGDSYVVASGLPTRNGRRHAGEIASMALELLSISGVFVIRHMPTVPLLLRIGINTGCEMLEMDSKAYRKRRSLPGPAGMLPKVPRPMRKRTSLPTNEVHQDTSFSILNETDDASEPTESGELFDRVRADCGLEAWSIVSQYSIENIHRMASQKGFPRGKIPVMCAALDKVDNIFPDAKAVLKDASGSIGCTIDRSVFRRHKRYLISGTILLLKQVSLFSLNWKTFYLNVTQSNIVRFYLEGPLSPPDAHPPNEVEVVMPASTRPPGPTPVGLPPFTVAHLKELVSECLDPLPQPEDEENSATKLPTAFPRDNPGLPQPPQHQPHSATGAPPMLNLSLTQKGRPIGMQATNAVHLPLCPPLFLTCEIGRRERSWRLSDGGDSCPTAISRVPPIPRKSGGLKALLGTGVVSTPSHPSVSPPVLSQAPPVAEPSPGFRPPDPVLTRPPLSNHKGNCANDDACNESDAFAGLLEDDMDELLASVVAE
nr:unnamed protein product [Spirometra erinaceieuropaei]